MASESGDRNLEFALKYKRDISALLAFGGMLSLVIGLVVLFHGTTGNDESIIKINQFEVTLKGLGAVIMATSLIWAFLSYKSRPNIITSITTEPDGNKIKETVASTTLSQSPPK